MNLQNQIEQEHSAEIARLRERIVNQKGELRRLNRQLSLIYKGYSGRGFAEYVQKRRNEMVAAFGEAEVLKVWGITK